MSTCPALPRCGWTGDTVDLYIQESIALQVFTPNAAVALTS
ncbi:MAG: hypothetical protein ACO20A_09805 [Candidatus Nanopelagicales bacterium]